MKKIVLLFLTIFTQLAYAEPDLPDGYELLLKVFKCEMKQPDFAVYTVELIKPIPDGFGHGRFEVALEDLDLKPQQYFAIKNIVPKFVGIEVIEKTDENDDDKVLSRCEYARLGISVNDATCAFLEQGLFVGVGQSLSKKPGLRILRGVREVMGGDILPLD